ncbi:MAG: prepilin peptidase [Candidatus Uhrbacteria bacterium]
MALLVFVIGLTLGSFINAVIFRTHINKPVTGRSKCMCCDEIIKPYDLIPLLSFMLLKHRCRSCKSLISWQYPLVELTAGLMLLFMFLRYSFGWWLPVEFVADNMTWFFVRDSIFVMFLLIIFVYDARYSLILDRFTLPVFVFALVINIILGMPIWSLLVGAISIGGFFYLQHVLSKGKWIGGGDIRMGLVMGAMLGLVNGLAALFVAYVFGALIGFTLIILGKAKLHTQIPFGTFLAVATVLMLIFGDVAVGWYLSLF